jgi:hypothetical protein
MNFDWMSALRWVAVGVVLYLVYMYGIKRFI